ncbi:iron uptake porin [Pleurocapsa sp. PCC 7319]|uniref:iron uptake porin n=1 Tax=Pleurocapsa sp. PCC 7319 TaxID=118161 RepID=UPI0003766416|nr:iron uptake porin [Pleurocapsa sp. PCC 7319]
MRKIFKPTVKLGIVAIATIFSSSITLANTLESIPAVFKLKLIHNSDREYLALQSLAQRYSCSTKFSHDLSNIPITRYEFAVGLNNCLQQFESISDPKDLATWQRLQQNFALELVDLSNKIDEVETDLNQVEVHQFSTTTRLNAQVLFFLADSFGQEANNSATFSGYRTRLDFDTSFDGQDLLKIRLENRNIGRLDDVTDTFLSRLSVDGDSDGRTEIAELSYAFSPAKNTEIMLGTVGVGLNDIGEVLNPFSSSSQGALSRFARRDPATLRGAGGSGIGIEQEFSDKVSASAGYLIESENVANPEAGRGIWQSSASAIAQLVLKPKDKLALALTYTHIYQQNEDVNLMGSTGIEESNQPFGSNATTANNLGLQFNWIVNSSLEVGGWFGYTQAQQQNNGDAEATILNGALTFAFPDLLVENNLGGIIIGVPPAIANHDDSSLIAAETPLHIEALYRVEIDDNIEITPGFFTIINPDTDDGSTLWVGTVRTLFRF